METFHLWLQIRTPESRHNYDHNKRVANQCKMKVKQVMWGKIGNDLEADYKWWWKKLSCPMERNNRLRGASEIVKNSKDRQGNRITDEREKNGRWNH